VQFFITDVLQSSPLACNSCRVSLLPPGLIPPLLTLKLDSGRGKAKASLVVEGKLCPSFMRLNAAMGD
jgi:hypothetical protein